MVRCAFTLRDSLASALARIPNRARAQCNDRHRARAVQRVTPGAADVERQTGQGNRLSWALRTAMQENKDSSDRRRRTHRNRRSCRLQCCSVHATDSHLRTSQSSLTSRYETPAGNHSPERRLSPIDRRDQVSWPTRATSANPVRFSPIRSRHNSGLCVHRVTERSTTSLCGAR